MTDTEPCVPKGEEERKFVERIISACVSTAPSPKLTLLQENNKRHVTRQQIHALIIKPFGTGKSTVLKSFQPDSYHELAMPTMPGLIGSITKTGDRVDGAICQAAGKTLVIDEYQQLSENTRECMLKLLEDQYMPERPIGYKAADQTKTINRKHISITYNKSSVQINRINFSCLCLGTRNRHGDTNQPWMSRFICMPIIVTDKDAHDLLLGRSSYNVKYQPLERPIIMENYSEFVNEVWEYKNTKTPLLNMSLNQNEIGYGPRAVTDLVRLACYEEAVRFHNETSEPLAGTHRLELKPEPRRYLPTLDLIMHGYKSAELTEQQYCIYNMLTSGLFNTQQEIADRLGVAQSEIARTFKKLKESGYI